MRARHLSAIAAIVAAGILFAAPAGASYRERVLSDSPSGYWRGEHARANAAMSVFDEVTGSFSPSTGHWSTGLFGDSNVSFDTPATIGDVHDFAGRQPFTLEAWVRPRCCLDDQRLRAGIVSKEAQGQAYRLYVHSGGFGFIRRRDAVDNDLVYTTPTQQLQVYRNHHVVGTYDGTTMRLYVDGVLRGSMTSTLELADHAGPLTLGSGGSGAFPGDVDEPAVYGHALTATDVSDHHTAGQRPYRETVIGDGPAFYMRFEDTRWPGGAKPLSEDNASGLNDGQFAAGLFAESNMGLGVGGCCTGISRGDVFDFSGTAPFALEAWVRPNQLDSTSTRVFSKEVTNATGHHGYLMYAGASGFGAIRRDGAGSDGVFAAIPPVPRSTHHLVTTYDGATLRIYVDGVLRTSNASMRSLIDHSAPLMVGSHSDGRYRFDGTIDEPAVYQRALTAAEVAEHNQLGQLRYRPTVLGDGPLGYWRFENVTEPNQSPAPRDETGNGNDSASSSTWEGGLFGESQFAALSPASSGGGGFAFGDRFDFAGRAPFTVEAWARPSTVDGSGRRILSKEVTDGAGSQGYLLFMNSSSFGVQRRRDGAFDYLASTGLTPQAGRTYHVVGTYDGTNLRLYVDGVLRRSMVSTKELVDHAAPFRLGSHSDGSIQFHGALDEPAVYDRALSSAEVAEHYDVADP